jgi:hypothetical protein
MNNNKLNNQIPHRIAAYLGTQAGEIVKLEEWHNCYYVRVRGQRPTFISKNITLPCIPIWALHQLHYGFSWERNVSKQYIKERIEGHKNIVELCDWYGWTLDVDEYGWRIEGQHTTCYYGHLERDILARLADAPTRIETAIAA